VAAGAQEPYCPNATIFHPIAGAGAHRQRGTLHIMAATFDASLTADRLSCR
jgi:hypothetical protein